MSAKTETSSPSVATCHDETAFDSCSVCPIEQGCCRTLVGLRLTPSEYGVLFAPMAAMLEVEIGEHVVMVDRLDAGACPHWRGRCSIYADRPVECRLYPHTISHIEASDTAVSVHVNSATPCPSKAALLHPPETVRALCEAFIAQTGLAGRKVSVHDHGPSALAARLSAVAVRGLDRIASFGAMKRF